MTNDDMSASQIIEKLEEISALLSSILQLSVPPAESERYGLKGEQRDVYELCDSRHTIEEISKTVGKKANQIRKTLTRLRQKGLVDAIQRKRGVYYFRVGSQSPVGTQDIHNQTT